MQLKMIEGKWPRAIVWYTNELNCTTVFGADFASLLTVEKVEMVKFGNRNVPITHKNGYLKTYWEDRIHGLKTIVDYTADLFGIDVDSMTLTNESFWMIDWVKQRQVTPLRSARTECKETLSDEEYTYMLKNCHPTESLHISASAPPNFKYTDPFHNTNEIFIVEGNWITIENLLAIDSIEFIIYSSKLSSLDLNLFFKHWQTGGFARLEYFATGLENVNVDEILGNGLEVEEIWETRIYDKGSSGIRITCIDGHRIVNKNGVEATINCKADRVHMVVWK